MSISFSYSLENIVPYSNSEEYSDDIASYIESDLSSFELGLVKFCYINNSEVSFYFGEERMSLDLWYDIYELVTRDSFFAISAVRNKRKMSLYFPRSRWDVSSQEYYDNKVKLTCWSPGSTFDEYYTECIVDELINKLIHLADDIISLAIESGYIDRESSNEFLTKLSHS